MMFRRRSIQETFLRETNQEFELENEDNISYRESGGQELSYTHYTVSCQF